MKLPIATIILTYNEEGNIENCLKSVFDFSDEIFVVDSFSTDRTLEIVKKYTNKVFQHEFENYGKQRNWALENLPIKNEWVLNLDADHRVTNALKESIEKSFSSGLFDKYNGFMVSRKTIFMNRWIKHGGHYPSYHNVLFKRNYGRCEDTLYDQHFKVDSNVGILHGDIEDIIGESISKFTERHNKWSTLEAEQSFSQSKSNIYIKGKLSENPIERKRYFKDLYLNSPLFIRSLIYFFYRYFLKAGFLDGKEGLIFHFLQGFWFRFLVDAKIYESIIQSKK